MIRYTRRMSRAAPAALALAMALGACSDRTPTAPVQKPKARPEANVSATTWGSTSFSSIKWHPGETSCTYDCNPQLMIVEEIVNEHGIVTDTRSTPQFGATSNTTNLFSETAFTSPHRNTAEKLRLTLRKVVSAVWTTCVTITPDMPTSGDSYTATFPATTNCPSGGSALAVINVGWSRGDYAIGSITVPATTLRQYDTRTVAVRTFASNGTEITGQTVSLASSYPSAIQVTGCTLSSCTIKALTGGTATLTATDPYTGVQGTATATATARPVARVDVTPTSPTLHPGGTVTLTARAYDAANAEILGIPTVTWSSSNTSVASITASSGATATVHAGSGTGTATVSATMAEGTGSATVSVVPGVSSLTLDKTYAYNEYATATASVSPAGSYYYQWQYRFCSNSTLASDCNGAYYAGTSGVNVTSLTKYVYARDYWVEFIVTVRASATGTIYDTRSIRVDGAGQRSTSTGGGGGGTGGDGGCTPGTMC